MPSYARLQNEPARLQRAYIKGLSLSAMLMAPLSMGVFAVAPELVNVLFGEKWIPMIPTLQIFAFMALARPLAASTSPLFQAVGKPEYDLQGGLVVLAAMVPMVLYMATWGIEGVAVAVVLSFVAGLIFNVYKLNGLLPGVARQMVPAVAPSLVSSALMVGAVAVTRQVVLGNVPDIREWVLLLVLIAAGGAVFVAATYLMQRTLIHELIATLGEVLKGNRFIAAVSRRAPVKA
jgi:PST family polysaccharide transporter/lipopolysaccharide exporter